MSVESLAQAAYIVAALLFILSLAGLSKHETSRMGSAFGIIGMTLALAATIWYTLEGSTAARPFTTQRSPSACSSGR